MAKIILETNNTFSIGANASDSTVYGAAGTEKVILAAGSYASIDQNVERTELSGASSSYTYTIAGNKIIVSSGSKPVATIIGGNGNKTIAFSDGSATLALTGLNKATLGGKTISTTASALSDMTLNIADTSNAEPASSTTVVASPGTIGSATVQSTSTIDFPLDYSNDFTSKFIYTEATVAGANAFNIHSDTASVVLSLVGTSGDVLIIDGYSGDYTAKLSGSKLTLENNNQVITVALAAKSIVTLRFYDGPKIVNLAEQTLGGNSLITKTGVLHIDGVTARELMSVTTAVKAALTDKSGKSYSTVDAAITSNDATVISAALAGTGFTSITDFIADRAKLLNLLSPATFSVALDSDTGISTIDNITNDGTIEINGTAVGATLSYSVDAGKTFIQLTGSSFILPEGVYAAGQIKVKQTIAGVDSAVASLSALTVDSSVSVPKISLAEDTGSSATDGITNVATVNVRNLEVGATWQYSINGADFVDGVGTSFTLPVNLTYGQGDIIVRQTDKAGNESDVDGYFGYNISDWTIDNTAAKLTDIYINDTGTDGDYITADGTVTVYDLEIGAELWYSIDGAFTFAQAIDNTFVMPNGTYDIGKIFVKQIDAAGNLSESTQSQQQWVVENNNSAGSVVAIDATDLTLTGTSAADIFNIASGSYKATIADFKTGDKLKFFAGAAIVFIQDNNQGDGYQEISATDPNTGATAIIALTGLTSAQDDGAFNVPGFNNVFGSGSLV
jgi:hypothetical protein